MAVPSYAHGASNTPLLGETIGENLRRTVERHGGNEALVSRHQGYRATYQEFWDLTGLVARGLMARGVKNGDRVGIWSPNRYEWTAVQYGTARMGAILVNINPAYRTSELEYALNQSGVSFLIMARAFRNADYEGMLGETIGDNLKRTVDKFGGNEALVVRHQNFRVTYNEFWELTGRAARGLLARGVKRGDRVGIWAPNRYEWTIVQYATARMGAILVNINPAYKTAELEYALNQSGVSFLILAAKFRTNDYVAMLGEVRGRCKELREALVLEDGWEALLRDAERFAEADLEELEKHLQFDDPINIQYTSGTTGFPKGATLSHHNILNNGYFIGEGLHYT